MAKPRYRPDNFYYSYPRLDRFIQMGWVLKWKPWWKRVPTFLPLPIPPPRPRLPPRPPILRHTD